MVGKEYVEKEAECLLQKVSRGIEKREFKILYQPKFDMRNMKLIGVEALIRWEKSCGKMIYPDYFIPQLERSEKVYIIDYYVIEDCMKRIHKWINFEKQPISIAINVAKSTVMREEFLPKVKQWMSEYSIDSKFIEFELTERECLLSDIEVLSNRINEIKSMGIKVSLDDFGSGSSNILVLANIDFDCIKIDKSAIDNIENNKVKNILIGLKGIMDSNKVYVLAEGVENKSQYKKLIEYGYSYAQGYYLSKPLTASELEVKYLEN